MKKQERQEKKLPVWRSVLAIVMVIAATVLLIYGSAVLTTRAVFSKRIVNIIYKNVDIWAEYGETATKAMNIGIAQLTNTPYEPDKFVNQDQLRQLLDLNKIKAFMIDKTYGQASAVINDEEAVLDSAEIVTLFLPVKTYVEKEYGISLPEEEIRSEIARAIGHDRYITSRDKINAEIAKTIGRDDATFDALRFLSPGRAIACIIVGALMLAGVYGAAWPRINFVGFLCIISCIVLCISLIIIGILVRTVFRIDASVFLFDKQILQSWINQASALFIRRAFLALLGCIAPILLGIIYTYDRKHVNRIWKRHVDAEK